jgi:hypothetical protein
MLPSFGMKTYMEGSCLSYENLCLQEKFGSPKRKETYNFLIFFKNRQLFLAGRAGFQTGQTFVQTDDYPP